MKASYSIMIMEVGGFMFNGLSKKDVCEAIGDAIGMVLIFFVFYIGFISF
jgi:hypothetical protein